MRSHVNIFDSIILGFARGERSAESWHDEFPQREAACPLQFRTRMRIISE